MLAAVLFLLVGSFSACAFGTEPLDVTGIFLQTNNQEYVCQDTSGQIVVLQTLSNICRFGLTSLGNSLYLLRAPNGLYLRHESNNLIEAVSPPNAIDPSNQFTVQVIGTGQITLQTSNSLYWTHVMQGPGLPGFLEATSNPSNPAVEFTIVQVIVAGALYN